MQITRSIAVLALVLGALLTPQPAAACGIFLPLDGEAYVTELRGLIIRDGRIERVLVELTVAGDAAEAVWILPTPSFPDVGSGEARIFDELHE
jgi:hypothetical protein